MIIRDQKEFVAGILFATIGGIAVFQSQSYEIGTITRMGPGYFPAMISIGLIFTGTTSIVRGLWHAHPERLDNLHWGDMALVLGAVVLFAVLIDRLGLIEAIAALVIVSCSGRIRRRPIEVLAIGVALIALAVGVFIYGLNIPVPLY
jgi:predicted metal-binding membrane protein